MIDKECAVAILMATHNGSQWIDEQIKSIFEQQDVSPNLYVIDDKSTDDTVEKILKWKARGFSIHIFIQSFIFWQ